MGILSQPFPKENSFQRKIANGFIGGFVVALFLRVFSPFGFDLAPVKSLNLFAAGYGIVTCMVVILFAFFEMAVPSWFAEEKWTVGKNILLYVVIVFLIGTANFYYTAFVTDMPISAATFINFQLFTLAVTFIVVSTLTMIRYFRSMDFYKKDAIKVEQEVNQLKPVSEKKEIILKSENEKENLQLFMNDLFYIESADNYSKVVFSKDNKITSLLIRSSLKRLEDQLTFPELFRCHRSYIVQLRNVEKVSGNSQGYRLHFKNIPESIPVSRNTGKEIHVRISQFGD